MALLLSGVTLGNITGGPSSLTLADLGDVSIVSPQTGQYLRYNSGISEWQNNYIDSDVYNYLDTNLTSSNGVTLSKIPGPNTIDISLNMTATGDATGSVSSGALALTLATVNGNVGTFGSSSVIPIVTVNAKGLITAISTASFGGIAPLATNLQGGAAGSVPYQSAADTTTFLAAGTTSQVMISGTSPAWTNTPTLTGTNFTGIPNTGLVNNSLTIGSTNIVLGATATTIAGLSSLGATTLVGALTGNASTATALATGRTFSVTGDATGTSAAFDGTAAASIPLTLATVGTPVGDQFVRITTNTKGLVSATAAVTAGNITTALGYTPVNKAGDTMTGLLVLSADPVAALGAATKQYVDNVSGGLNAHASVATATTAALPASTYDNVAVSPSGVGATLTANANGAIGTVGGYAGLVATERVLVKNQAAALENGIYTVTQVGTGGSPWILTRATDFDQSPLAEVESGDFTYIRNGTLGGTQWVLVTPGAISLGVTSLTFTQLSGTGTYTGGTGINVAGTVISNTGVLSLTTNTGLSSNVSATGNVTVTNTGVTSVTGTANQISVSGATGAVTFSLPATISGLTSVSATTFTGALSGNATTATTATNISDGVAGNIHYQSGASTTALLATGTTSQVLISGTTPAWTNTPTLTGTNFTGLNASNISTGTLADGRLSGTYTGVSITGNAATATTATSATTSTRWAGYGAASDVNAALLPTRGDSYFQTYDLNATNKPISIDSANGLLTFVSHPTDGVGSYGRQFAFPDNDDIYTRNVANGSFAAWNILLRSGNFNNYAPTLTGTGASGTWGINITGNAVTLGGLAQTSSPSGSTIAARDPSGYLYATYLNQSSGNSELGSPPQFITNNGGDGFLRKSSAGQAAVMIAAQAVTTGTNVWQFLSNTPVGSNGQAGTLSVYGNSGGTNAAVMNFHRPGQYAVNMGLDTDNVFRLGGWSDGTNTYRFQSYANGDLRIRNNMYLDNNYGNTIIGLYDPSRYQGVFSMGAAYLLPADGTTPGNLYGIAWTHTNVGGESKAGLSHQALFMANGITQTAVGTGVWTVGDVTAFSDARVKENVEVITNALDKIDGIRGVTFTRNDQEDKTTRRAGVIAQEVELHLPEVVTTDAEGMKSVAYGNMVALLIEAIKELKAEVNSLKAEVAQLRG